jgi:dihydrodipicolinate synthase/N-acetylneuraminate lyase
LLGFCAVGCVVVTNMLSSYQHGKIDEAVAMRPLVQGFADFIYQNPVLDYRARCKAALAQLGVIDRSLIYVRPPMLNVSDEMYNQIGKALQQAGMLPVTADRT